MSEGNPRRPRVAQALRGALGEIIQREVDDPRVKKAGLLSINHVDLNSDMSVAHVYVTFIGADDDAGQAATDALNRSGGYLRGTVGRTLKMKRAPELRFLFDTSGEFRQKLADLTRDGGGGGGGGG